MLQDKNGLTEGKVWGECRRGRGPERRCLLHGRRETLRLGMHCGRYSKNEGVEDCRGKKKRRMEVNTIITGSHVVLEEDKLRKRLLTEQDVWKKN